ncbi:hypothetical protein WSM22_19200 [Cytophagales bacterium WSM2-2]|nr:hypothetical protein WSM22_19200 [Cytophagales bacterium WSM2-2]
MWTQLRQEIEKTRTEFHLQDRLKSVGLDEWKDIEERLYNTFSVAKSHRTRPTWIWENLKVDNLGIATDGQPYQLLDKLIDPGVDLFLFLNETVNEKDKFWIYEGRVEAVKKVIEETIGIDEVIIIDKKYNWILCVNHHDVVIVGGQLMVDRLKNLIKR